MIRPAIGQNLFKDPECAKTYSDDSFNITGQARFRCFGICLHQNKEPRRVGRKSSFSLSDSSIRWEVSSCDRSKTKKQSNALFFPSRWFRSTSGCTFAAHLWSLSDVYTLTSVCRKHFSMAYFRFSVLFRT